MSGASSARVGSIIDGKASEEKLEHPLDNDAELKESARWNVATYHLRRSIQTHSQREELWVETALADSWRAFVYNVKLSKWFHAKYPNGYPYRCYWAYPAYKWHSFDYPQPEKYSPFKLCQIYAPKDNAGESLRYTYERNEGDRTYPFRRRTLFGYEWSFRSPSGMS